MTVRPDNQLSMVLSELVAGEVRGTFDDRPVTGITLDSREVKPGWLYVALPGRSTHGARFAAQAIRAGAAAVLTDSEGAAVLSDAAVPVAVASDPRSAIGRIAARFYGYPAERLTTFGLTGTNGKTTTAFLIAAALADRKTGTIGTIGFHLDGKEIATERSTVTTPESPELQSLLALMLQGGAEAVAIEVSSHALDQERVSGIRFDQVAFIGLGRDHLDFHRTPEAYFEAKAKLFTPELARSAVINIGDPAGAELMVRAGNLGLPVTTVGTPDADYWLSGFRRLDALHTATQLHTPSGSYELRLALPGEYNALNAMLAFALATGAGVSAEQALAGLSTAQIPGRMQSVDLPGEAPMVVVDFAHTPQAVAAALATFSDGKVDGKVIAVIGAGGDRDATKRGAMGAAAAEAADLVIVTDDNPRTEPPGKIRAAVLAGIRDRDRAIEVAGRAEAIRVALDQARPGDVVAVLGKGHERGQIIGQRILEFDDVTAVRQQWTALREDAGCGS